MTGIVTRVTRGQTLAAAQMLDTFLARRPDGFETTSSRLRVPKYIDVGPTPGKVQARTREGDTTVRETSVGGQSQPVVQGGIHLPVSAAAPSAGDLGEGWEYELIALGPDTPPDLLGSRWLVVDAPAKSHMTARRLDVVKLA